MANKTIDINESTIIKFVKSLRPDDPEIREQLDVGYSYDGKTVILFEIRSDWMNPKEKLKSEFVKIRYYKSRKEWNLYWMRANGKWKIYEPFPVFTYLDKVIEIIKKDEYGCFFG